MRDFIEEMARGAGNIILEHFGRVKHCRAKEGRGDVVTEVDIESEKFILDRIRSAFPKHNIISEEAGIIGQQDAEYMWLIDPLDGTRNYTLGIPFFCVSIALAQNGMAQYGVVYDPLHDELFYAAREEGAELNGMPIQVSSEVSMEDAIISISWLRRRVERSKFIEYVDRIAHVTSYFRRLGSAALISAYVAAGRADAYMQGAINSWDIAAGTVLIEEAGGKVTDFDGQPIDLRKPYTDIIAANPDLHESLMLEVIQA